MRKAEDRIHIQRLWSIYEEKRKDSKISANSRYTLYLYIYMNDLDKTYLHHDMDYIRYKDLVKKTESNKVLRVKAFKIAIDAKYDSSGRGLVSIIY